MRLFCFVCVRVIRARVLTLSVLFPFLYTHTDTPHFVLRNSSQEAWLSEANRQGGHKGASSTACQQTCWASFAPRRCCLLWNKNHRLVIFTSTVPPNFRWGLWCGLPCLCDLPFAFAMCFFFLMFVMCNLTFSGCIAVPAPRRTCRRSKPAKTP